MITGGDKRDRTADLLRARQALSQLSYIPILSSLPLPLHSLVRVVGLSGLEPPTSPLSGVRSNHLSYRPKGSFFCSFVYNTPDNLCEHSLSLIFGKEVIQPQVPLRLPCYDFTPVMNHTVVNAPLAVKLSTSGTTHSHGVTGGVYKARERIHRDILIRDY